MTIKRNLEDSELEKVSGGADPNQHLQPVPRDDADRSPDALSPKPIGGGGGGGNPEIDEADGPGGTQTFG